MPDRSPPAPMTIANMRAEPFARGWWRRERNCKLTFSRQASVFQRAQASWMRFSAHTGIGNAHLADQPADLQRHNRPATTASRLPAPIRPETRAMPADKGVRLNDRQRIANSREQPIETNEYQSVDGTEGEFLWSSPPQNVYLLPQRPNLCLKHARDRSRSTTVQPISLQRSLIPTGLPDSRSTASRMRFATGTGFW